VTAEHSHADAYISYNEDEEQSNDGLDNNSSDDEELPQPDENSEYDLDKDTLDDTKIEALFAPATWAFPFLRGDEGVIRPTLKRSRS
jgi:hypothetical protein